MTDPQSPAAAPRLHEPGGTHQIYPHLFGIQFQDLDWKPAAELPPEDGAYRIGVVRGRRDEDGNWTVNHAAIVWRRNAEINYGDGSDALDDMSDAEAKAKGVEILRRDADEAEPLEDGRQPAWGVRYSGWLLAHACGNEDGETGLSPLSDWGFELIAWADAPAIVRHGIANPHPRDDGYLPMNLVEYETGRGGALFSTDEDYRPTHVVKFADGRIELARRERLMTNSEDFAWEIDPAHLATIDDIRTHVAQMARDFYVFRDSAVPDLAEMEGGGWLPILGRLMPGEVEAMRAKYRPDLPSICEPPLPEQDPSDEIETLMDRLMNAARDDAISGSDETAAAIARARADIRDRLI